MRNLLCLATAVVAVFLVPRSLAQSPANPAPLASGDNGTLIAWTMMQQPVPMQSQNPPAREQQPDSQYPQGRYAQQDRDVEREPATQSFAGTVMMENDHYVLKTSDNNTYQLDDQERAKEYEGKQVQVMGVLNSETNMIRVRDIKMAS